MSSGKELARTITCPWWKDNVEGRIDFCWAQIYNSNGTPISPETAKGKGFCHLRVVFKFDDKDKGMLMGELLRQIANVPGEQMGVNVFDCYGFTEIVIS